jgi:hypothetical protein
MCMFGSKPKVPAPPPLPATDPDPNIRQARLDQQRRARAAQGYSSTIATGPMGDGSQPASGRKDLLGQ